MIIDKRVIKNLIEKTGYFDGAGKFSKQLEQNVELFIRKNDFGYKSDSQILALWETWLRRYDNDPMSFNQ